MESISTVNNLGNSEFESDDWIFSSEAFGEGDEFTTCIPFYKQLFVEVSTKFHKYKINTRIIKHTEDDSIKRKTIIFSHGHATECNWVTWIKSAVFLFNCGYDVVLFDLPGFGRSLVNGKLKVHFKNWITDGPDMFRSFIQNLNISSKKVSCCGFCGGGALMIRTMAKYPQLFEKHHMFYNLMISAYPDNFESIASTYKFTIRVFWTPDIDHPKYSVGYKYVKNMNKKDNKNIRLVDINNDDLGTSGLWAKGYGRSNSDYLFIFLPSFNFFNFQNSYFEENITEYSKV
jgi:pimeloyl-ACP methyl ester carboxylesterase